MKKVFGVVAFTLALTSCGQRAEFAPETVAAYQTDEALRTTTLQKCASHAANHLPFATQSDTEECQKAAMAQGNVNYAAHLERERRANERLAAEINGLTAGNEIAKH